jgi:hypothetical protein
MARERGQVDSEAGMSMRHWGWRAYKSRDATFCPYCKRIIFPAGASGTWDYPEVWVPQWESSSIRFIDVEVKAANTSMAFADLRENQREWASGESDREKWLWIGIGKAVNSKKYTRKTWFMPLEAFYELECSLGRASIPYNCESLDKYELQWAGDHIWTMPGDHPFNVRP